jgi:hypothetical protein
MPRIRVSVRQMPDRHFFVTLNAKVGIITQSLLRAGKGGRKAKVVAAYFGFDTQQQAVGFAHQVRSRFPKAMVQIRTAKRLGTAIEVKVCHSCVEDLAWQVLAQQSTTGDAIAQHIAAEKKRTERLSALPPVVSSLDRSTAPLQGRSRPKTATVGRHTVSIE